MLYVPVCKETLTNLKQRSIHVVHVLYLGLKSVPAQHDKLSSIYMCGNKSSRKLPLVSHYHPLPAEIYWMCPFFLRSHQSAMCYFLQPPLRDPTRVHQVRGAASKSSSKEMILSALTWRGWIWWQVELEGIFLLLLTLSRWGIVWIIHAPELCCVAERTDSRFLSLSVDLSQSDVSFVSQKSLSLLL